MLIKYIWYGRRKNIQYHQFSTLSFATEDVFCQYLLIYSNGLGTFTNFFHCYVNFTGGPYCGLICLAPYEQTLISFRYLSHYLVSNYNSWQLVSTIKDGVDEIICYAKRTLNVQQSKQIRMNKSGNRTEMGKLILLIEAWGHQRTNVTQYYLHKTFYFHKIFLCSFQHQNII